MSVGKTSKLIKKPVNNSVTTLDEDEDKTSLTNHDETEYFHFASFENPKQVFQITEQQAKLCGAFKAILDNESLEKTSIKNPLVLPSISQVDSSVINERVTYTINTRELLDYVIEYLNIWKDSLSSSDYCNDDQVKTGDPSHILKQQDINFIKKYITEQKINIPKYDEDKYNNIIGYKRKVDIQCLARLASQADDYLQLDSLGKKIYKYLGTIVWNMSLYDVAELDKDEEFIAYQKHATDLWKTMNPEKSIYSVPSVTAGDGVVNSDLLNTVLEDE